MRDVFARLPSMRAAALLLLFFAWAIPACAAPREARTYALDYQVEFLPAQRSADVRLTVEPGSGRLVALDLAMPGERYTRVEGDGVVERRGERVSWQPPREGGTLSWRVEVDRWRGTDAYDSRLTRDWVITRGDLLFPPARVRATRGSHSVTRLRFVLPAGWEQAETPYRRIAGGAFAVDNPERAFDRPTGWIAAGQLSANRETIAGTQFSLVSPDGENVGAVASLALLRLAVPELRDALGPLPRKVLIVRAGDPMWRGGLSGPGSFWLHADRPDISSNGTSPLLHELTHVVTGLRGEQHDDWIAEGLAEYYSLEIGRRAGLISQARYDRALRAAREADEAVAGLRGAASRRDRTRKAVALFARLDAELRGRGGLDALVQRLARRDAIDLEALRAAVSQLLGRPSKALAGVE